LDYYLITVYHLNQPGGKKQIQKRKRESWLKSIKTARLGAHLDASSLETPSSYLGRMSKGNINKKKVALQYV